MHERVPVVARAAREMGEALDGLYGIGTVIEEACCTVALVEIEMLVRSGGRGAMAPLRGKALQFRDKVLAIVAENGLTWGEAARAVHHLSDSWLNVIVRIERHGDREDARADLAYDVGDHA